MKKHLFLLLSLFGLTLSSCDALDSFLANKNSNSNSNNNSLVEDESKKEDDSSKENDAEENHKEDNQTEENKDDENQNTNTDVGGEETKEEDENKEDENKTDDDPPTDEEKVTNVTSVSFSEMYLDIEVNASRPTYLAVNYSPDPIELSDEEKAGTFSSSDSSVATVDNYGRLKGVKEGSAVITFTTLLGSYSCSLTAYVHTSLSNIKREFVIVEDVDDIKVGDELVFACPSFGVAASINEKEYYIDVTKGISFSGNIISNMSDDVAKFLVCPGKKDNPDCFTLQRQDGKYLAGKITDKHQSLYYFKNEKAQVDWIIENPDGYEENFIVNYDIEDDYWLMFNKRSSSDIRFNLYDSNETTLMAKPTIYRNELIR